MPGYFDTGSPLPPKPHPEDEVDKAKAEWEQITRGFEGIRRDVAGPMLAVQWEAFKKRHPPSAVAEVEWEQITRGFEGIRRDVAGPMLAAQWEAWKKRHGR